MRLSVTTLETRAVRSNKLKRNLVQHRYAMKELKNTLNEKRSLEEETKRQGERSWFTHDNSKCAASGYVAGLVTCYFLSDKNLKSNVTFLPSSKYNDIGLTGVCWKWNDIAQRKFGFTAPPNISPPNR